MEWPRVKNILIVLLAIVNVFLFVAYISSSIKATQVAEENIRHTVSVLQKRGFSIDKEIIPRKGTVLYPVRTTQGEMFDVSENLIGPAEEDVTSVGAVRYKNDYGEVTFENNGEFEVKLTKVDDFGNEDELRSFVREIAKKLKMSINNDISISTENGTYTASVIQTILDVPIYNCGIKLQVMQDNSSIVSGRMISDEATILRGEEPRDINGLLLNLVEILETTGVTSGSIDGMTGGFFTRVGADSGQNRVMYSIPLWKVTVSGVDYYINAMNGEEIMMD